MAEFAVAHLDQIEEVGGSVPFRAVRKHFGIDTFGVNVMTAKAVGDAVVTDHTDNDDELYFVMAGHASFEVGGVDCDAPSGTFVFVPGGLERSATALAADTAVLVMGGGSRGEPYEVSGWDLFAPLIELFAEGRYEEGADRAQALLEGDPPYAVVYYNTACFEARAGRIDDALAHLRRALELRPSLVDLAREDEDLDALRGTSEFKEIIDS